MCVCARERLLLCVCVVHDIMNLMSFRAFSLVSQCVTTVLVLCIASSNALYTPRHSTVTHTTFRDEVVHSYLLGLIRFIDPLYYDDNKKGPAT